MFPSFADCIVLAIAIPLLSAKTALDNMPINGQGCTVTAIATMQICRWRYTLIDKRGSRLDLAYRSQFEDSLSSASRKVRALHQGQWL